MSFSLDATEGPAESPQQTRERFRYYSLVSRLPRSIVLAEISALPWEALLNRLGRIWTEGDPWTFLEQFLKRKRTETQDIDLLQVVDRLADESDRLAPKDRDIADRTIYRLLHTLPRDNACPLALRCATSKRAKQRQAAYRFYKVRGVDPNAIEFMLADYQRRRQSSILEVIIRDPEAVQLVDPEFLIREFGESYWSARVFETLLRSDRAMAEALAPQYPIAFLWGAAREDDSKSLPVLRDLLRARWSDAEFVGWSLWAFGKLRSPADVAVARSAAEALILSADPFIWGKNGPPIVPAQHEVA